MIIIADAKGRTDGSAHDFLQKVNSHLPIVLVSKVDDFVFNEELLKLDKYILIDYVEMGWNWDMEHGHIWGVNTALFPNVFSSSEWFKFEKFVQSNPPVLTFQRELLFEDVTETVLPIEYPSILPAYPIHTKEQFNNRPFETFFCWGLSHEYRKTLHGNIWQQSGKYGYVVSDSIFYINEFLNGETNPHKWLTYNIPWYARQTMDVIMQINGQCKISVCIAGAGRKCFRHSESPANSVMLMWEDDLAWSYDWQHGINCLKCKQGEEIETIIEGLNNHNLYDIYLNSVKTLAKYQVDTYIKEYIEPLINAL